jgi:hypothetical protein
MPKKSKAASGETTMPHPGSGLSFTLQVPRLHFASQRADEKVHFGKHKSHGEHGTHFAL